MEQSKTDEEKWPGMDVAYSFVLPSYQMVASRFEAADGRLTALLTMASSITLAAPILARSINPTIPFSSGWFRLGMFLFVASIVVGLVGRIRGKLTLPNPMAHYEKTLHLTPWEAKQQAVYFAGKHFMANADAVLIKGNTSIALTVLFVLEIGAFVLWMALA